MERHINQKKHIRKCVIFMFWFAVWFGLAAAVDNKILVATPVEVLRALISMLGKGNFYFTVGRSMLRIGGGFLAGAVAAVLFAAGSRRHPLMEEVLAPVLNLMKAVPVASFVVLFLIWWGASFLSVAICFLVVLPNIYISTLEGLKNTDWRLLEMAKVFRLPFWNRFFYIYRPALKPFLYGSLKISLGMCWKSGIAAEVMGTPDYSIGEQMYLSKVYLDTAGVFAWTAVVVVLSIMFEKAVLWLAGVFFAWEPECKSQLSCEKKWKETPWKAVKGSDICRKMDDTIKGGSLYQEGKKVADAIANNNIHHKMKDTIEGINPYQKREEVTIDVAEDTNLHRTRELSDEIRCESIIKIYQGRRVLDQVSAVYRQGQTYYLTSPSGSGKTTLLRILAGLTVPDSGIVKASFVCGMVFQEDRLCEDYSAVKNVALITGDSGQAEEALRQLLEEEALYIPCHQLSGGMKRRVALVRAMESDSHYILLDEPFTGMDAQTRERAKTYIRAKQKGRTLIIATHT